MTRTVTVGLDGSRESHAAARWAAREALRRSARLELVLAWENDPYPYATAADESAERTVREAAADLSRRYPALETRTRCLSGRPSKMLVGAAEEADLLVLGSRGLGLAVGFLVGSVALPVVAHVSRPVVLVRAGAAAPYGDGPPDEAEPAGEIVVGLDLDRPPEEPLTFAFETAARWAARLRVVHGWGLPPAYGARESAVPESLAEEMTGEKDEALRMLLLPWRDKWPEVDVDRQVSLGWPARELLQASSGAPLVVVGRRRRTAPVGTRIGSVTHAVLHHTEAPVAVVPHD
ncbi:universal stress protein [Streptomyces armeniacus]|uniref:Universal stress protein n=1 Tax=Streptomyces armeniacus TaxID=83291 RepID=A0A345XM36_9ACTN|nr:universal stress protein [Streptomyces armeniacus]AXK32702.1 universal stress protein [Streptomyces armeniacus]